MATRCRMCNVPIDVQFNKDGALRENCSTCEADVLEVCRYYNSVFEDNYSEGELDGRDY